MQSLTLLDQAILKALSADWRKRSRIAAVLGVEKLNYYHIQRLEQLVALGLIEKRIEIRGTVQQIRYYRVKGELDAKH